MLSKDFPYLLPLDIKERAKTMTITKDKLNALNKVLDNQQTIEAIKTKLNRWQKVIDNSYDPLNPVVQQARDEVTQECINTIRAIIDN